MLASLRYLLSDLIGEGDDDEPFLPEGLPETAAAVVSEAIHRLIEYQGAAYAQLYADRLRRFVGKPGVDDAMFHEIARLMAIRMSYEDIIRIAQLKLAELEIGHGGPGTGSADDSLRALERAQRTDVGRCLGQNYVARVAKHPGDQVERHLGADGHRHIVGMGDDAFQGHHLTDLLAQLGDALTGSVLQGDQAVLRDQLGSLGGDALQGQRLQVRHPAGQ